jgi:predicted Ser/Thr protein kinase
MIEDEKDDLKFPMDWIIGSNFKININQKLGSGSFGEIYRGTNLRNFEDVAVKLEKSKNRQPQLCYEARIYKILQGFCFIIVIFSRWSRSS